MGPKILGKLILTREYFYDSPEYIQELELRNRVLRLPLGMELSAKDTEFDAKYIHFGAFQDNTLIGCLLLYQLGVVYKMKQVAVDVKVQSQGIGTVLVSAAEEYIKSKNGSRIELDARKSASAFYLRNGYQIQGPEFLQVGIPHFFMFKELEKG
jgi:predicted GNAT family N-acyltransferase